MAYRDLYQQAIADAQAIYQQPRRIGEDTSDLSGIAATSVWGNPRYDTTAPFREGDFMDMPFRGQHPEYWMKQSGPEKSGVFKDVPVDPLDPSVHERWPGMTNYSQWWNPNDNPAPRYYSHIFGDQGNNAIDVQEDINTTDKWITPVEGARTIIKNPDYIPPEGWRLPDTDFGPVRRTEALPPRGRLDRFLQRFGVPAMTQVTAADKLANKQFMGQQGIGRDPQTGRMIGGDFEGMNAPGTSGWGSANFGEMATKWDEDYGDMVYKTDKMKQKQTRMKQLAAQHAQKVAADRQERIRNERAQASAITARRDPTGRGASGRHMGNISQANAQAVAKANAAASMSGWGLAQGGRVGYNTGGRVGILAAF